MIREARAAMALIANREAALSRRTGAPRLSADSPAETVAAWLQWCDPNGSHTKARAEADDFDAYTDETAWRALAEMLRHS